MKDSQKQFIRDLRRAGHSYNEIAEAVSLSVNTVKSFCRRENIEILGNSDVKDRNTCECCGRLLLHHVGKKKKRFCNDECRSAWWNHNRQWARTKKCLILLCQHCGAEFNSYGNKNRKYCGRDCYIRSRYGEGLP